jgi:hypothetical protein
VQPTGRVPVARGRLHLEIEVQAAQRMYAREAAAGQAECGPTGAAVAAVAAEAEGVVAGDDPTSDLSTT